MSLNYSLHGLVLKISNVSQKCVGLRTSECQRPPPPFFFNFSEDVWVKFECSAVKLYRFGTMTSHAYDTTYLYCQQLSTARGMPLSLYKLPLLRFSCFSHGFYLGRNCHIWNTPLIVHSFRSLSHNRSVASSEDSSPHVRSSASSLNFQYPLACLSSSSCLRPIHLLSISNVPFIFLLVALVGID